jgi:putative protease
MAGVNNPMELLAPAGAGEALEAALRSGASAVYLGLRTLNARRRARNFTPDELPDAIQRAHEAGARVYLTLNIDLTQRELGQAARMLELARQCGVDAVLVRDPALLALKPLFPKVEFHFSTQTCMANSADVQAARTLGIHRIVLARELTLKEIAAASAAGDDEPRVETEVFVQGALCFCVSGRCLLSSWVGGRSGNRGSCTSPCRAPWTVDSDAAGTPLSMHDLAAVHRLDELGDAGVTALKIEGRLKTAAWVGRAVSLYRRALDGDASPGRLADANTLGAYTGRAMTDAYLDGHFTELTGLSGREAASRSVRTPDAPAKPTVTVLPEDDGDDADTFSIEINITDRGIDITTTSYGRGTHWTLPRSEVRRAGKAVSVGELLENLGVRPVEGCQLASAKTNEPDFLLVPRAANAIVTEVSKSINRARKKAQTDEPLRIELPDDVRDFVDSAMATGQPPADRPLLTLDAQPNRLRIEAARLGMVRPLSPAEGVIVEGLKPDGLAAALDRRGSMPLVVALPAVFFEGDVAWVGELCSGCAAAGVAVEANTWGGWSLAQQAGAKMEAGPGMGVLNALAGRALHERGMRCVSLSVEADKRQLQDITAHGDVPWSITVFGRPPLMTTRAQLPNEQHGRLFEDRRGVKMRPHREHGLWTFRPDRPFDLRGLRNPAIRVRHLVMDLVGSPDPVAEWRHRPQGSRFTFNYKRSLA